MLYGGDDLGDLAAYAAVERLRGEGVPGVLVACGGGATGENVPEIAERADLVVDGPEGLVRFLGGLADRLDRPAQTVPRKTPHENLRSTDESRPAARSVRT